MSQSTFVQATHIQCGYCPGRRVRPVTVHACPDCGRSGPQDSRGSVAGAGGEGDAETMARELGEKVDLLSWERGGDKGYWRLDLIRLVTHKDENNGEPFGEAFEVLHGDTQRECVEQALEMLKETT